MITEIANLYIKPNQSNLFEHAFQYAQNIIRSMEGYINHQILKCMEVEDKYVLIVKWETLEDHMVGFRNHERYTEWKECLHHFYSPFPIVEHYKEIEN